MDLFHLTTQIYFITPDTLTATMLVNFIKYMNLLYKFISPVSMLHYSYRKYEKLLQHYAHETLYRITE